MTLQEAKDKAAQEAGYENFTEYQCEIFSTSEVLDRAMEIYASQQRTEVWNSAIEAAAESAYIADDGEHIVSKQSILKLKR